MTSRFGMRLSMRRRRCRTATFPTAFCPTRRSTSSTRPPRASRWNCIRFPTEIDEVQRRITRLEIAARQLAEEDEESAEKERAAIQTEMDELKQQLASLKEQWEAEKLGLGDVKNVREELEQADLEFSQVEAAIREKQAIRPDDRRGGLSTVVRARSATGRSAQENGRTGPRTGRAADQADRAKRRRDCSAPKSARKRLHRWSRPGPVCRSHACCRPSGKSCSTWKT